MNFKYNSERFPIVISDLETALKGVELHIKEKIPGVTVEDLTFIVAGKYYTSKDINTLIGNDFYSKTGTVSDVAVLVSKKN